MIPTEGRAEMTQAMLHEMDRMSRHLWRVVERQQSNDGPGLQAIAQLLRVQERKAWLMGLDAPTRPATCLAAFLATCGAESPLYAEIVVLGPRVDALAFRAAQAHGRVVRRPTWAHGAAAVDIGWVNSARTSARRAAARVVAVPVGVRADVRPLDKPAQWWVRLAQDPLDQHRPATCRGGPARFLAKTRGEVRIAPPVAQDAVDHDGHADRCTVRAHEGPPPPVFTPVSVQSTVRFPGVDELWLNRWESHGKRLDQVVDPPVRHPSGVLPPKREESRGATSQTERCPCPSAGHL
jgi:hypothetical protein